MSPLSGGVYHYTKLRTKNTLCGHGIGERARLERRSVRGGHPAPICAGCSRKRDTPRPRELVVLVWLENQPPKSLQGARVSETNARPGARSVATRS